MNKKLTMAYLRGKMEFRNALQSFTKEEKGASDIVAILLVIVILVAVAAVFREQLMNAVTTVFDKLNDALSK